MKTSNFTTMVFIIGILIAGMYGFLSDLSSSDAYDYSYDTKYQAEFDEIENVSNEVNDAFNEIQNLSASKSTTIGIITLVPDMMLLARDIIITPFKLLGTMIYSVFEFIGLPSWATSFAYGILGASIIFAIISLILRFRDA